MTPKITHRDRISNAAERCTWIAPCVKTELYALNWDVAGADDVTDFIRVVLEWGDTISQQLSEKSPPYCQLLQTYAIPGEFEKVLSQHTGNTVVERMADMLVACAEVDHNVVYLRRNCDVLGTAMSLCIPSVTQSDDQWWAREISMINGLMRLKLSEAAQGRLLRDLQIVPSDRTLSPELFVTAIDAVVGNPRDLFRVSFLQLCVQVMSGQGWHRHALAAAHRFFRSKTTFPSRSDYLDNTRVFFDRIRAVADEPDEDGQLSFYLKHLVGAWCENINFILSAERTIRKTPGFDETELLGRETILDGGIGGWPPGADAVAALDLLISLNQGNEVISLGSAWIESLLNRGIPPQVVCGLVPEADPALDTSSANLCRKGRLFALVLFKIQFITSGQCIVTDEDMMTWLGVDPLDWPAFGSVLNSGEGRTFAGLGRLLAAVTATGLHFAGEHDAVIDLLEGALDLWGDSAYGTQELFVACSKALDESVFNNIVSTADAQCYAMLLFSLAHREHVGRAEELVRCLFGVEVSTPGSADVGRLESLHDIAPDVASLFIGGLTRLCSSTPFGEKLRPLVERLMGLPDVVTADDHELQKSVLVLLDSSRRRGELFKIVDGLRGLADMVATRRGPKFGQRLLEAVLGIAGANDAEVGLSFNIMRDDERGMWAIVASVLGEYYTHQNSHVRFLRIAECLCDRGEDGAVKWCSIKEACLTSLPSVQEWTALDTAASVQQLVFLALRHCGMSHAVIEEIKHSDRLTQVLSLCGHQGGSGLYLSIEVAYLLADFDSEEANVLYQSLQSRVHDTFQFQSTSPYDRFVAARNSGAIRNAVSQLGYTLALGLPQSDQVEKRLECLLLDCRLMNQTFAMRWQLGRPKVSIDLDPSLPRLKMDDRGRAMEHLQRERLRSNRGHGPAIPLERPSPKEFEMWNQASEFAGTEYDEQPEDQLKVADVIDAAAIANCLQVDEVLLRASFDLDGRMVWTLFRRSGNELHVVGTDHGTSERRTQRELTEAVSRFDSQLSAAWDLHAASTNSSGSTMLGLGQHLLGKALSAKSHRSVSLLARILQEYPRLLAAVRNHFGSPEAWPVVTPEWKSWWNEILGRHIVGVPANHSAPRQSTEEESVHTVLDRITAEALREFARIINVGEIAAQLSTEVRLVVWADDILLSVPWSFLTFQDDHVVEAFLFECVKSVRLIVSPLLDKAVRERHVRMERALPAIVGSLVWLGSNDSARNLNETADTVDSVINATSEPSEAFRNAIAEVSTKYSEHLEWWSAEGDSGSHEALARGLHYAETRNIAALIVCGHGSDVRSGVVLKDGVWDGSSVWQPPTPDRPHWYVIGGVNLERVDFLIQVSCSIGRPGQQFGDVAGFCTEFFLNRGCSVLAGRWPLDSKEGIDFAKAVADLYLSRYTSAVRSGSTLWQSRIRSEAVAHVRKEWARSYRQGNDNPDLQFGLNTIANMDLYGLG